MRNNPPAKPVLRRRVLAGLAAAPAALIVPPSPVAAGGQRPAQVPRVVSAEPNPGLTAAFAAYGNSGQGWTGADSTYSRRLPGGRHLWMFSDTFLGTVNPDGSRPPDSPIVNNTFIVQRGASMTTIHGGTAEEPEAILVAGPDQWYWLGGGYFGAGAMNVMFIRFQRTGPGMFDWVWRDNLLARFRSSDLSLLSTHPMPSAAGVTWSSWLDHHSGYTYVYGTEDLGSSKYMHVARVAGDDLRAQWRFFDGSGWSRNEADSARVMVGVANEYSVTRWRGRYLLVTHNTNVAFSNEILAYVADSPTGPFTSPTLLYRTPETGAFGSYGDPNVITYNAHEHPDLRTDDGRLLVTYNVNSLDFAGVIADVTKYRPRFIDVRLEP
jgi:uncharacterized protein DUF4185